MQTTAKRSHSLSTASAVSTPGVRLPIARSHVAIGFEMSDAQRLWFAPCDRNRQTVDLQRSAMDTLWLLRPCSDGGTDYICFRDHRDHVEVLEGYHLPPQMPLIKHRQLLLSADVPRCRHRFERQQGFRHGPPLF